MRALLSLVALLAADPARLAPSPADLDAAFGELESRLVEAEALADATARLQNAWVESGAPGRPPCSDPADAALVARAAAFGREWQAAAQAARASGDRLRPLLEAPTLAPLLEPVARARAEGLLARVDLDVARYAEASAWQGRYLTPASARCPAPLAPAAGLARSEPDLPGGAPAVALAAVGGGRICPMDLPADGRVVVSPTGRACLGVSGCGCEPVLVLPGAVLGP